jgi:6-phosphogluconolactonase (cycloisomerase 2 family)
MSFNYGTAPATASYIYVANQIAGTITGLSLSSSALAALPGASYNLGGTPPSALATTPSGSLLYMALQSGPIYVYGVNSKGALVLGNSGQPVTSNVPQTSLATESMTTDRTGNWLFLVSSNSTTLLEFQINPSTGVLVAPQGNPNASIQLAGGTPTQVYVTPNNQFVFVGLGTGGVEIFAFNPSNGALSSNPLLLHPLYQDSGDNTISSDANSQFLFVGETVSGVRVFNISTLKEVSGSPFPFSGAPDAIVMDPTNTYVYVSNKTSNTISGYTLGSTGTLTPLSTSPFTVGTAPIAMSLDASGQYMLVASYGGGPDLQVFSFDTASPGKLDVVTSTTTGADPTGPISMAVAP